MFFLIACFTISISRKGAKKMPAKALVCFIFHYPFASHVHVSLLMSLVGCRSSVIHFFPQQLYSLPLFFCLPRLEHDVFFLIACFTISISRKGACLFHLSLSFRLSLSRFTSHIGRRLSVVSRRLSFVGCRSSVVSRRLSVVGCRLSDVGCRLSVVGHG